jgi:hypothetical protein
MNSICSAQDKHWAQTFISVLSYANVAMWKFGPSHTVNVAFAMNMP